MELLILVVAVGLIVVVVAMVIGRSRGDDRPDPTDQGQTTPRSAFPEPGEPAPRREGRPIPGSRDDRRRHGKP